MKIIKLEVNEKYEKKLEIANQNFKDIEKYYNYSISFSKSQKNFYSQNKILIFFKTYKSSNEQYRKIANDFLWSKNKFNFPEGIDNIYESKLFVFNKFLISHETKGCTPPSPKKGGEKS
ncbi:MAG: hypothetical protein AAFQ80_04440 [Cyanobacteria bacterium J06621_8]